MKRLVTVIICLGSLLVVTACTTAYTGVTPSSPTDATREAGIRASRLCFLNDTTKTIAMVKEWGTFNTGDHHPDPEGPLPPGKTWCTNGFDSGGKNPEITDATAQLIFNSDGTDAIAWGVFNSWLYSPKIFWDYANTNLSYLTYHHQADTGWEFDLTFPYDSSGLRQHDYHVRRLDDSEFFIEWLVTIRS
jgi:hypothetical protein